MMQIEAVNEVALRAGEVVMRHYTARDTWVRAKEDGSPVTRDEVRRLLHTAALEEGMPPNTLNTHDTQKTIRHS